MNIYCLLISYNQNINESALSEARNCGITPVVFDNSTDKDKKDKIQQYCIKNNINYESLHKNVGLPKAYNFVIKKYLSTDDWIIFLDQDTEVTQEYFDTVTEILKSPASLSYFTYFQYGKNRFGPKLILNYKKYKIKQNKNFEHRSGYLIGINSCMLVSKKVFDQIGYFNENLFLDYVDCDFSIRLAEAGIKSETIDVLIRQRFFTKEKAKYSAVKKRYQNQKYDGYVFFHQKRFKFFSSRFVYMKEKIKFALLYSFQNNIFWFFGLIFTKKRNFNEHDIII